MVFRLKDAEYGVITSPSHEGMLSHVFPSGPWLHIMHWLPPSTIDQNPNLKTFLQRCYKAHFTMKFTGEYSQKSSPHHWHHYTHIHVLTHIHTPHAHIYTHINAHTIHTKHAYTPTCTYTCKLIHSHAHTFTHWYTCTHTRMLIHTYTDIRNMVWRSIHICSIQKVLFRNLSKV